MNEDLVFYDRHYVRLRADGAIVAGWSDGPHSGREPTADDVCINEQGGYQFRLILNGGPTVENPALFDGTIPLYKWDGETVVRRGEDELDAERRAAREAAEAAERERVANDPQTLLLEAWADHEERICLMEMGVTTDDL